MVLLYIILHVVGVGVGCGVCDRVAGRGSCVILMVLVDVVFQTHGVPFTNMD